MTATKICEKKSGQLVCVKKRVKSRRFTRVDIHEENLLNVQLVESLMCCEIDQWWPISQLMPVSGLPLHRISTTSVARAKNHTDDGGGGGGGGSDTAALSSVLIIPYSFFLPLFRMDRYSLRVHPFDRAELPATLPVNQSQLHRMIRNQSGPLQRNNKHVIRCWCTHRG